MLQVYNLYDLALFYGIDRSKIHLWESGATSVADEYYLYKPNNAIYTGYAGTMESEPDSNYSVYAHGDSLLTAMYQTATRLAAEAGFTMIGRFDVAGSLSDTSQVVWEPNSGKYYSNGSGSATWVANYDPTTNLGSSAWIDKSSETLRSALNIVQKRFACVADMVADTTLSVGQIAETLSYYSGWAATSAKPKGGNRYEIVAASTGTADGGAFITLSNGFQAKALFIHGKDFYQFGAYGDDSTDDSIYIQSAVNSSGSIIIRNGSYKHNSQITLVSNLKLRFEPNAIIKPSDSISSYAWYGAGLTNIKMKNAKFVGTGTAYTTGTQRLLTLVSSSNITIEDSSATESRNDAFLFDACTNVKLKHCEAYKNYGTGAVFRNGSTRIKVTDCDFYSNGTTSIATAPNGVGGRGLLFWQCSYVTVHGGSIQDNSEYGLRFYSQAGDTVGNTYATVSDVQFNNNGTDGYNPIDLYLYDEAAMTEHIAVSNCSFYTKGAGTAAVLQGKNIVFKGNTGKGISAQSATAMNFYGSTDVIAEGNTFEQYGVAFVLSNTTSHVTTRCKIRNNSFNNVATGFSNFYGSGNEICSNTFTHGGSGTSDTCMTVTSTGTGKIHDNAFSGFYRAMNIATTADVSIKRNRSKDSTGNGVYALYQTDNTNLVWCDNDFDAPYPSFIGSLQKRSLSSFDRAVFYVNLIPTTSISVGLNVAWKVGDRAIQNTPVSGNPKSWVCTTAGTPGTWTSEGSL